jgi:hypothetical protein
VFSQKKFKFCVQAYSPPPLGHIASILSNLAIVINSPEVCFGVTRQYAKVGCKHLIIVSYKNHLCRSCRNGKKNL